MIPALLICAVYAFVIWLVFFRLRLLRFTIPWAVVSAFVGLHLLLIFLIGVRFVAPYSTSAVMLQHTIQLIPRLPEPTLVTAVLVEPNVPVRKGQPLFQFDRRQYEHKVAQLEAELAAAKQNVRVLKADVDVAVQKVVTAASEVEYSKWTYRRYDKLAKAGAASQEDVQKWLAQMKVNESAVKQANAEVDRARLRYQSEIGGVNTKVAAVQAELDQVRYYLDNTTLVAPEDGRIVNLQVRPGMVSGDWRIGAIASFIVDADRYLLAPFSKQNLKYVQTGQPVDVALDLYPGQIFKGKVHSIWRASGEGQLLPSGVLPKFEPASAPAPPVPEGRFAVRITLEDQDQSKFPIGAQGAAAIFTGGGGFAALRRIDIRTYSWLNWLYPLPF